MLPTAAGADRPLPDPVESAAFPRQQARTRGFRLGAPRSFTIAPDGSRVAFLRSGGGAVAVTDLWCLDLAGGGSATERRVVDAAALLGTGEEDLPAEERARRERMREVTGGVTAYATDEAVSVAVFALSGTPYAVDLAAPGAAPRPLPAPGPVIDPRPDPTGTRAAYVSGRALHVVALDGTGGAVALAEPGSGTETWGLADFAAAEELERVRGFWWSPDGTRLLVERFDTAPVDTWWIADPARPDAAPVEHRYPAAGTPNADVTLWLVALDGTRTEVRWDRAAFPYVASVHWSAAGDPLLQVLTRDQRTAHVLAVDPLTGGTRTLREDRDDAWVDVVPGVPRWTPDSRLLHVAADAATDTHRVAVDGTPLSPAGLQVHAVVDVDDDGVVVVAAAEPEDAALQRVSWDGAVTALGPEHGRWSGHRRGAVTVLVGGGADDTTAVATVRRDGGTLLHRVASWAEEPLVRPRVAFLAAGDRALRTAVLWPTGWEPGSGRLPVLMSPYGGPHAQRAVAYGGAHLADQWWADQGFCVVVADGAGTPGRGPAFEREVLRDLATPVLDDQVRALDAVLAAHPDADGDRVGIRGWSFGGYLSALAVLRRPDRFHAAVAGAPVTEWRLYDTAYTERYLGDPTSDAGPYDACSLLPLAADLRRPLLIVHGLADDNVVAAHTLRLSSALLAAGRPHAVVPLSGVTHMTPQEDVAANLVLLELDFLRHHLADPQPLG